MLVLAYGMPTMVRIGASAGLPIEPPASSPIACCPGLRAGPGDLHRPRGVPGRPRPAPPARSPSPTTEQEAYWRRFAWIRSGYDQALRGLAGLTLAASAQWTTDRPATRRTTPVCSLPSDRGRLDRARGPGRRGVALRPRPPGSQVAEAAGLLLGHGHRHRVLVEVVDGLLDVVEQQEGQVAADPLAHQDPLDGDVGHRAGQRVGRYLPAPAPAAGRRCRRGCSRGPPPPGSARPPTGSRSAGCRRRAARRARA